MLLPAVLWGVGRQHPRDCSGSGGSSGPGVGARMLGAWFPGSEGVRGRGQGPWVSGGACRSGQQVGGDVLPHGRSAAPHGLLDPAVVLAEVGVDSGVARQGTALHPPGHKALELPLAHQGSPRVSLRGRNRWRRPRAGRQGHVRACVEKSREMEMGKHKG